MESDAVSNRTGVGNPAPVIPNRKEKTMRAFKKRPVCRTAAVFVAALMILTTMTPMARAASHREAPLIALDPAAQIP